MYDGIQLLVFGKRFYKQLVKNHELFVIASNKTGEEKGLKVKRWPFLIHARESGNHTTVKFNGSLHNYYHSKNNGIFTHKEICSAVDQFCKEYGIFPSDENIIQKIEFGVNLYARYPKGVIDSAMLYRGRTPYRVYNKKLSYKEWRFDQYCIKLYQKSTEIIRLEIHINEMRKIQNISIKSIYDLKNLQCCVDCLIYLYSSINNFLFIPFDNEKVLSGEEEKNWNSYRAESFWENISKDSKYYHQKRAKKLTHTYGLIDWSGYLKKQLVLVASEIIGVSGYCLDATNSDLGLLAETVARPLESGDRQTEYINHNQLDGASTYIIRVINSNIHSISIINGEYSGQLLMNEVVLDHLCRSPPDQSIKRMFYRNYAANGKISFKPSFDVYLLVQKS